MTHSFSNNNTVLDLTIPETLIGTPSGTGINLLLDINNTVFMPASFSNQYTLKKSAPPVPGTAADKRIGIVYSATSSSRFWSSKNYAQLFMSMQAQAMQAGIPFDMLTEDDLLDLNKVVKYYTLVFPSFTFVPASKADAIATNLNIAAFQYQIGLVTAGSFMTNDETGAALPGDPYSRMKTLFGITREGGNASPTAVNVKVSNVTHPITQGEYTLAETNILAYPSAYTEYYTDSGTYPATSITPIATQTVSGATHNAALAIQPTNGGRNVHFATVQQMTDANLLWSALRWSAIGAAPEAGITLGRNKALFLSRNDMDMSMYANVFNDVEPPLLSFLQSWKNQYNFVGSYYLDVGNNPAGNIYTNWAIAKPLYDQYLALGNEIGNHSYTHPFDTNTLADSEFPVEFGDARTTIEQNMALDNVGTAIPGAPDTLETANKILPHAGTYLSGGYSGTGAGINNAFGYLSPTDTKVYLSPNMTFDFTNIEFLKLSATATLSKWNSEFDALTRHAKRAIIHWPWHDYGPTIGSQADFCDTRPAPCEPYSVAMFHDLIAKAYLFGVEFITGADMSQRINSFRNSRLETTTVNASTVTASLQSTNAGRFGLDIPQAIGATKIKSVNGWYAYNDNQVFSDRDGGSFTVNLGTSVDAATHITELPSRAELVSLTGTGEDLNFTLVGEGSATILTQCAASSTPTVTGASSFTYTQASKTLTLKFNTAATHNVTIDVTCP